MPPRRAASSFAEHKRQKAEQSTHPSWSELRYRWESRKYAPYNKCARRRSCPGENGAATGLSVGGNYRLPESVAVSGGLLGPRSSPDKSGSLSPVRRGRRARQRDRRSPDTASQARDVPTRGRVGARPWPWLATRTGRTEGVEGVWPPALVSWPWRAFGLQSAPPGRGRRVSRAPAADDQHPSAADKTPQRRGRAADGAVTVDDDLLDPMVRLARRRDGIDMRGRRCSQIRGGFETRSAVSRIARCAATRPTSPAIRSGASGRGGGGPRIRLSPGGLGDGLLHLVDPP
jgi:hypothetical protein